MIRKVRIDAGKQKFNISLDENYFFENQWTRISGNDTVCPSQGSWKMGHKDGSNSHYLYVQDKNGNNIFYMSQLTKNVGDRGLAMFLSQKYAIARHVIMGWEITSVEHEMQDYV